VYPLVLGGLLGLYGLWLGHRLAQASAAVVLACWLGATLYRGYHFLREVVAGLDQIALGLALFGVAVLVSLAKAGVLRRLPPWAARRA
jgi:hypothetical protein